MLFRSLHAAELSFRHPVSGVSLLFRSEWPADLGPALAAAGDVEGHVAPSHALAYFDFFGNRADG